MAKQKTKADEVELDPKEEGSEEQEGDSQRRCLLCGEIPDSIICLNCGHNIDIPCATRVILESQTGEELDISKINCLLCGKTTFLSGEVQAAIIAYGEGEQLEAQEEGEEEIIDNEEEAKDGIEEGAEEEQSFGNKHSKGHKRESLERAHENSTSKKSKRRSENEMKESISNTNPNELSLHFACITHTNEEYAYYSASSRQLYCAQCLLDLKISEKNRDLKSLKRSLPIIGQHLQELVSGVEASRGLIGNRKKDAEIKIDDLQVRLNSLKYKTELKFDELAERILVCKQQFSDAFSQRSSSILDEVNSLSDVFNEKIAYLDAVINQIEELKDVDGAKLE